MSREYVYTSTARKLKRNDERQNFISYEPIKRDKKKTVQISPLYVIMLTIVAGLVIFSVMNFIELNSQVTTLRNQKGKLTNQYEKMLLSNDLYYDSIMSKVDLAEIERIAVVDLGMKMADKGQVIEYSSDLDDYVKQYADLPNP